VQLGYPAPATTWSCCLSETVVLAVAPLEMLAFAVVVLFAGAFVNARVAALERNFIPPAGAGGLLFSLVLLALRAMAGIDLDFDMQLRDLFFVVFF
jgi:glutamate:Na+ symporter, ESS family